MDVDECHGFPPTGFFGGRVFRLRATYLPAFPSRQGRDSGMIGLSFPSRLRGSGGFSPLFRSSTESMICRCRRILRKEKCPVNEKFSSIPSGPGSAFPGPPGTPGERSGSRRPGPCRSRRRPAGSVSRGPAAGLPLPGRPGDGPGPPSG